MLSPSTTKSSNKKTKYLQRVPRLALKGQHIIHHVSVSCFDAVAGKGWLLASSKTYGWGNVKKNTYKLCKMNNILIIRIAKQRFPIALLL